MGTVIFDTSMSLDGYMTAADQTPEEPMGAGGLRLMEWALGRAARRVDRRTDHIRHLGAVVGCRRTVGLGPPAAVRRHT